MMSKLKINMQPTAILLNKSSICFFGRFRRWTQLRLRRAEKNLVMFFSTLFCLLCTLVASRPTPSELGVTVTKTGRMRIGVDGSVLKYTRHNCPQGFLILYATTQVTSHPGFCSLEDSGLETSSCPLKLDAEDLLDVKVESLTPGCIMNAFFPLDDNINASGVPIAAIIVPCVIGGILFVLALLGFIYWRCHKRRKAAARAAQAARAAEAQRTASESLPTALPPSIAPSSTAIPSSTVPEATPTTAIPTPAKKPSTEQTSATPVPSSSNAVEKKPSVEKVSSTPAPSATAEPPPVDPVKPAPSTIDDVIDEPKKKFRGKQPPHWTDRDGHLSAARIHESYESVRSRGSKLSKRMGKSRKSKADSLEDRRKHFETVVECLGRHGLLEQFKNDEMVVSRSADGDGPTEYIRMQKRYHDDVIRKVDAREKQLLVSRVSEQFKLVQELGAEAEAALKKVGAEFPANGDRASFTDESRQFLMKPTTPAFVHMYAFAAEYGWVIPVTGDVDLEKLFLEFSVQTLLVVALYPHFPERTRRKALAFISRKTNMLRAEFETNEFAKMAYPLRLLPKALLLNPEFFKHMDQVKTYSRRSEPKKGKKCGKKGRSDEVKAPKGGGKEKCSKKRSSTSKEGPKTSASKNSLDRTTESNQKTE